MNTLKVRILRIKEPQITKSIKGKDWKFEVTGTPNWVDDILKKYGPTVKQFAENGNK